MSVVTAPQILTKQPIESLNYGADFVNLLQVGETIQLVTSITATPGGLTIGAGAISGSQVRFVVQGGSDGVDYQVQVAVSTNLNPCRAIDGLLKVRDT